MTMKAKKKNIATGTTDPRCFDTNNTLCSKQKLQQVSKASKVSLLLFGRREI